MNVTKGTVYLLTKEDGTIIKATDKKEDIIDEAVDCIKNDGGEPVAYEVTTSDKEWNIAPLQWKDEALQKLLAELAEQD